MPAIRLIPGLMAALVVSRHRDGDVLVPVDADLPVRRIWPLARILLDRTKRWALWQAMAMR
jgi:hypothetical protein